MLKMDWSQISFGAVAGAIVAWIGGLFKTWLDYSLEQRKQRAAEDRTIRAEQRDEDRKEKARKESEAAKVKEDEAVLLMYKTQLRGSTELIIAAAVVNCIHDFFSQRPQYTRVAGNRGFLEKYPREFRDEVCYDTAKFTDESLNEIKRDVEDLRVF